MPKIVLTGDIHLGYPNRLDDIISALSGIRSYMQENDIVYCVILGDLFHTRQSIATDVMHKAFVFFEETKTKYNQTWMVFPGNHDMFLKNSWKIHSLKTLSAVLSVYDKPCTVSIEDVRFHILPYIHDEALYMQAATKIGEVADPTDVLLTHVGVCGATLNECFLHKNWSVVNFNDFPLNVYAGHFHCKQQVGKLWYPGSPLPFTFAEGLVEHGFFVFDVESRSHEFVKIFDVVSGSKLPDYSTILDKDVAALKDEEVAGNKIRITLTHDYTMDERVALKEKLMSMGAIDVSWMKLKEAEVDVEAITSNEVGLGNPDVLLKTWFELDKPEHLKLDMLLKLNKEIVADGNAALIEEGKETGDE